MRDLSANHLPSTDDRCRYQCCIRNDEAVSLPTGARIDSGAPSEGIFTTTITLAELLFGLELLSPGNRRTGLQNKIEIVFEHFADRILTFDVAAA